MINLSIVLESAPEGYKGGHKGVKRFQSGPYGSRYNTLTNQLLFGIGQKSQVNTVFKSKYCSLSMIYKQTNAVDVVKGQYCIGSAYYSPYAKIIFNSIVS